VLPTEVGVGSPADAVPMESRGVPLFARLAGSWVVLTVLVILLLTAKAFG